MCVKFLTSAKECFSESKKVYKQLCLLMKDIQNLTTTNIDQITDIPSCPNSEATFIQNQVGRRVILFKHKKRHILFLLKLKIWVFFFLYKKMY
jgi:hypothetical protein